LCPWNTERWRCVVLEKKKKKNFGTWETSFRITYFRTNTYAYGTSQSGSILNISKSLQEEVNF